MGQGLLICKRRFFKLSAGKSTSRAYDRVDLTITPKSGYVLDSWSVTPADETQNVETYYTSFNMPESDVTVSAEFSPVIPAREPYIDESGAYRLGNIEYIEVDGRALLDN